MTLGSMRLNRHAVVAVVGAAAVLVGGGAALAGGPGKERGVKDRGARCEKRLERIAEHRGVTVAELESQIKDRLLARVAAALEAGKISSERAAKLEERISAGTSCTGRAGKVVKVRLASHGMLKAAADFLGLDRAALKAQLPGNSLAGLAQKQGKSVDELEDAVLAPAQARLAAAVAAGSITQKRADRVLERLERLASRLVEKTFPAK
jgi:Asp-tRNA(Asn)/Glu-tRNA(Gln) amidotransferase B subunit